jgi:hypothetical protein
MIIQLQYVLIQGRMHTIRGDVTDGNSLCRSDHFPPIDISPETISLHKQLVELFQDYELLTKRIRDQPCEEGSAQWRLQQAITRASGLFISKEAGIIQVCDACDCSEKDTDADSALLPLIRCYRAYNDKDTSGRPLPLPPPRLPRHRRRLDLVVPFLLYLWASMQKEMILWR